MSATSDTRPWYREPFMWLVVGIPVLTVAAGLSTVVIAHQHRDTVISDEFRKEGLAIQHDPARDLAAARVGAQAQVELTAQSLSVTVQLGAAAPPNSLVALLSHATRADLDRLVVLQRGPTGRYEAAFETLPDGHWYLELSPSDRSWRLRGELKKLPAALTLRPGLSP